MAEIFVRVYRIPEKLTDGYCFGSGVPITFLNVDWFNALGSGPLDKDNLITFIKSKRYYDPKARFLVLGDHPDLTFVIEPS